MDSLKKYIDQINDFKSLRIDIILLHDKGISAETTLDLLDYVQVAKQLQDNPGYTYPVGQKLDLAKKIFGNTQFPLIKRLMNEMGRSEVAERIQELAELKQVRI